MAAPAPNHDPAPPPPPPATTPEEIYALTVRAEGPASAPEFARRLARLLADVPGYGMRGVSARLFLIAPPADVPGACRLRRLLKHALRGCGLRAVDARQVERGSAASVQVGAPRRRAVKRPA